MNAFLKKNLYWIFFAGWGLINFILLAIPYITAVVDFGDWGGLPGVPIVTRVGIGGYRVMNLWRSGFGGVMSSLTQIFVLLTGIGLLGLGIAGFLKEFNIVPRIPDNLGGFEFKKIGFLALIGNAALNVLLLLFLIITCASNTVTAGGVTSGLRLNAGIFIALFFSAAACAGLIYLEKMLNLAPTLDLKNIKSNFEGKGQD